MRETRHLSALVLLMSLALASDWWCAAAAAGERTDATASWPRQMHAARALLGRDGARMVTFGPWYTTGPLPARELGERLFPEEGVSPDARGGGGRPLWQARPEWVDGEVHDLPAAGRASTYLFRRVSARDATRMEVSLGSDDGLEVFFRGRKILSRDVARGASRDQDRAVLDLEAGQNELLLKIFNRGGGHGFYFSAGRSREMDLWREIETRFPAEASWMREDAEGRHLAWFRQTDSAMLERTMIERALGVLRGSGTGLREEYDTLVGNAPSPDDPSWLSLYVRCAERRQRLRAAADAVKEVNFVALRLAIEDLTESFPDRYSRGPEYLKRLDAYEARVAELAESGLRRADEALVGELVAFRREVLLANPLLDDFDSLLLVRRRANRLGLPQNWQGNCALPRNGYDNEIAVLSPVGPEGAMRTLYRPERDHFVGDVDLHSDADRMLFSMLGTSDRWQIWEIDAKGKGLRQVTPGTQPDVDSYDPCYLPDGRIIFASTACFHGVPCVGGGNTVANLYLMNADGSGIRQLCFDQDHDWCPTVLNNGRVLYSRWEYSDSPHYFTRLLFHMNPDGTDQKEYYASNSMWPNSIFYARPVPGHPTQVVAVISGHHGVPRMGELVLFDPARGRHQADGAVQRIPGYGKKVEPIIRDGLVNGSWPKFLHPYPLSSKYFVVSSQPTNRSSWGIYLVDVFDNMLLLKEEPGYALFEPVPFRKTPRPPIIPDTVDLTRADAIVYLSDVYQGNGLRDVPRDTVKKLRLYELHYAYPGMGGHINIGIDGPWDARRILGTVDVEEDGSALFRVPANTPISVQPLDAEGRALQIMRSWFTAMPGEKLSCVGCHESQNTAPPRRSTLAARHAPAEIDEWYGPARGFSFKREVQPVLDKFCVGCHNPDRTELPDFTAESKSGWRNFTPSYVALHPYVRRPGPESDYFAQQPLEFHASTSELVQMLEKGHHGVKLDREAWDRLITWIDLNVPDHGTWHEHRRSHSPYEKRRLELRTLYANRSEDPEEIRAAEREPIVPVIPDPPRRDVTPPAGGALWAFDREEAKRRVEALELPAKMEVEIVPEATLELVLVPAGGFVMGDVHGDADELPLSRVKIEKPFYMSVHEVTNSQYALFRPRHDSAYISMTNKDQSSRGHPVNEPKQPVIRITADEASAYCAWLSARTGKTFRLPTEAEWEWACRAGTSTPLSYGDLDTDFSRFANLADAALESFAVRDSPKWHPREGRFNDRVLATADVGRYEPNAWGLYDMHGNVAEWTSSPYRPYPYGNASSSSDADPSEKRVARGGSWYDRPKRARSAHRRPYRPWQRVFDVGFRVLLEIEPPTGVRVSQRTGG